jgi:DNA segregation ATPase FtsK/SpoIIIE-like protein
MAAHHIDRPPRIQPELPIQEIGIPNPPEPPPATTGDILSQIVPLLSIVGFAFFAGAGNPGAAILMGMVMVLSVAVSIYAQWKARQGAGEKKKQYLDTLRQLRLDMTQHHNTQRIFHLHNYPDAGALLKIAAYKDPTQETSRFGTRLWERRPDDADFGVIRLGMGTRNSTVVYTLSSSSDDNPLTRDARKLANDSRVLADAPVTILLKQPRTAQGETENDNNPRKPRIHGTAKTAIGVAGKNNAQVESFARALVCQLAAFHAPTDLRIHVIGNPSQQGEWKFAEWLPHCDRHNVGDDEDEGDDKDYDQICFSKENDDQGAFWQIIKKTLDQRQRRLKEASDGSSPIDVSLPFIFVVVDLQGSLPEGSNLKNLAGEATLSAIIKNGNALGASIMILADDARKLPSDCEALIEIDSGAEGEVFRYTETGINSPRYLGKADQMSAQEAQRDFAARIRRLDVQRPFGSDLPAAVTVLQMQSVASPIRIDSIDRLPFEQNWKRSVQPNEQEWLSVPIGMMSLRDVRTMSFHAQRDGVHGIVAGTTGSGKSEVLMTLVAGMAIKYDPRIVNFVLVDYKGGQAFEAFKQLPHTVDMLTNLQPNAVERMFVAIQAVMEQRAEVLAKSGVSDLVKYRAEVAPRLQPDDPRPRAFPHLFIIVDEFVEMMQANPDYRQKFESIVRLGRSYGVSLILAAQRPAGAVSDQMRANMKFKICLRVETTDDSKELLGDGDAAFLPSIGGRGYIKSGNDLMQGVQVAWAGERYTGDRKICLKDVYWLDEETMPDLKQVEGQLYTGGEIAQALGASEPPKVLLSWIVGAAAVQAKRLGVPAQSKPWPDPLPEQLTMTSAIDARYLNTERDLLEGKRIVINETIAVWLAETQKPVETNAPALTREYALWPAFSWRSPVPLRVDIGLVDNPYRAENRLLTLDVTSGPTVLFGAAGRGKTTFLKSLLVALGATRTPGELHMYALDFGRGGLKAISAMPHLGASIDASEGARVDQLLRMLRNYVNERQEQLGKTPFGSLAEYNFNTPDNVYADILVVIDNFAEFKESYEHLLGDLMALIRDGRQFGVYFIVTANIPADLGGKLLNLFSNKLTLAQTDAASYGDIVGAGARAFDNVPGRGLVAVSIKEGERQVPLEFQCGMPGVYESPTPEMEPAERVALAARNSEQLNQAYIAIASAMERAANVLGYKRPAAELPKKLTILDMWSKLDKRDVNTLQDVHLAEKWALSMLPENQEWLRGPVGLISDKDVRQLVFQAQADGVHGIVAGTTGSGKSELLQTLIASMAVKYDPRIVNFVLIDYKGGPTVEPFKKLPHAVDIATNLEGNAVERIFIAINAEMNRRSAILAKAGVSDLVEYRKKIIPTLKSDSPFPKTFPHLFIIVDEFAEMMQQNPDYKTKFESITRLGRSYGVSLILAAQRPSGAVSDQMRANMKFRLCLRVETGEDSKELLGRPDGARLPQIAGRGYVQAGTELLTEVQAAWSGAPYAGDKDDSPFAPEHVLNAINKAGDPPRAMLGWLVGAMALEAGRSGVPKQTKPWPDPMPATLPINKHIDATYMPEDGLAKDAVSARRVRNVVLSPALARWVDSPQTEGEWTAWDWHDKLPLTATVGVIDNPFEAEQMPLRMNVAEPMLVFGASGRGKTTFIKSILFALAAERSPSELNVYALDFGRGALRAVGVLPHCGAIIDSAKIDRIQALFRMLKGIMAERQDALAKFASLEDYNAQKRENPEAILPAIIFVIDNFAEFKENFEDLMPDLMSLVRDGRQFGIHFIISANTPQDIGSKLMNLFTQRVCFTMSDPGMIQDVVGRPPLPLTDLPGRGFVPVVVDNFARPLEFHTAVIDMGPNEKDAWMRVAERMEQASAAAGFKRPSAEIPRTVTLLEMHGVMYLRRVEKLGDLNIAENWRQSMLPENQDWLRAAVGLVSSKEVRSMYFTAKAGGDGVHGLAAGTTGSGKSELIQTMIASMAVKYDPRIVNFVLIDYKGGPTVEPFRALPHVVDIATNLDGNAVERIFVAISAEMNRRSAILAKAGVADLVEYRRKVIPTIKLDSPLPRTFPHLFIIVDEFAEMIQNNPDYKAKFESITRLGRSFGVSLILATQKPSGVVTDQMKANMKFRLCLRLETADDSKELLGRPDAAMLPSIAGRGYAQVGGSALVEFQAAYSGGPYDETRPDPAFGVKDILDAMHKQDDPPRSFLGWLVGATALEAQRQNIEKQYKPWPDLLPAHLSFGEPFDASYIPEFRDKGQKTVIINPRLQAWMAAVQGAGDAPAWAQHAYNKRLPLRAVCGIVDNTYEAEQQLLTADVTNDALMVLGAGGRGKTTFLKSFALALAAQISPLDLHVYALDFGRGGLKALRNLPHLGGIVEGNDDERIERLFRMLRNLIDERQRRLAAYEDFDDYNAKNPHNPMQGVLTIVDNVAEFKETYEKFLPDLIALVRDGRAFGVYFVLSAALVNDAPSKLFNVVNQKMTFFQNDYTDYQTILGKRGVTLPDVPGRGLVMGDVGGNPYPLEFHTALPLVEETNDKGETVYTDLTREIAARMKQVWEAQMQDAPQWKGRMPRPIEPLSDTIDLGDVLPAMEIGRLPISTPIGINDNDRETARVELDKMPHWLVVGPPMAGKTTTVRSLVLSLAHVYAPDNVALVLVDPSESARRFFNFGSSDGKSLADLPHVLATVTSAAELDALILRLCAEFDEPLIAQLKARPELYDAVNNSRRSIVIVIDHADDLECLERGSTRGGMAALAEIGKGKNVHFVLAGSLGILSGGNTPLRKRVEGARHSLVLQDVDTVRYLGVRGQFTSKEMPAGRGYLIRGLSASLVHVALPVVDGKGGRSGEEQLAERLAAIQEQYWLKARWSYTPADTEPLETIMAAMGHQAGAPIVGVNGSIDGTPPVNPNGAPPGGSITPDINEMMKQMEALMKGMGVSDAPLNFANVELSDATELPAANGATPLEEDA